MAMTESSNQALQRTAPVGHAACSAQAARPPSAVSELAVVRRRSRMSIPKSPTEVARHVVNLHMQGVICSGEVWNQFVALATAETFPQFMAELTPELQGYFLHVVHEDSSGVYGRTSEERRGLGWLSDYYAQNA